MDDPRSALLNRLDDIAASLARRRGTIALIGLGSAGSDLSRLDAYSDLDFFAIAERGQTEALIGSLTWLEEVAPIAFAFQNTRHGSKVLFEDGIYAEFAVFDPDELRSIPFEGARLVWRRTGLDLSDAVMRRTDPLAPPSIEWLLGEILTNLYVGLTRLKRGEALSAHRLIQTHAVDRLLELWSSIEPPFPASPDPFDGVRRVEQRLPRSAPYLAHFIQGYGRSADSALAILEFVENRFPVHPTLSRRIREIAREFIDHTAHDVGLGPYPSTGKM